MIRRLLVLTVLFAIPTLAHAQTRLLRQPSYSNGKGDVRLYGQHLDRQRGRVKMFSWLTVNRGRDSFPRFSPDGKWIAFSSNRMGNNDVYVMPAAGETSRVN